MTSLKIPHDTKCGVVFGLWEYCVTFPKMLKLRKRENNLLDIPKYWHLAITLNPRQPVNPGPRSLPPTSSIWRRQRQTCPCSGRWNLYEAMRWGVREREAFTVLTRLCCRRHATLTEKFRLIMYRLAQFLNSVKIGEKWYNTYQTQLEYVDATSCSK